MRNRGADHRLDPDRQALAADPEMIRYARGQAEFHARRFPNQADEFESAALFALVEAARTFDPGQGVTFKRHAANRVRGAILDAKRAALPSGYRRKLGAPGTTSIESIVIDGGDNRKIRLRDTLPAGELPVGWEEEYQDELRGLARRVSSRVGRLALPLFFGSAAHDTKKRTAEAIGVSKTRVVQVYDEAIVELKRRYGNHGEKLAC